MRAEVGLGAYNRLRELGLLSGTPTASEVERVLAEPFIVNGKRRNYRFPRQKAFYLSACLNSLVGMQEPRGDVALREALTKLPGVGLKTASWVVRNYRQSDDVAIVDVHILRAGRYMGLYEPRLVPEKNYRVLESGFLAFAKAIEAATGMLDGMMWDYMRRMPSTTMHENSGQYRLL
jgi:thermostable 8-oxoguanine DNA glycosylase